MSSFDFLAGDLIDEATENAGLDPSALTHRHLTSITRSLQLLLIELETDGPNAEFRTETRNYTIASTAGGVVLDADVIDVLQASILFTQSGSTSPKPYPLGRTTREDYQNLAFPTSNGTPSVFWISKTDPANDILPLLVTAPPATVNTPVLWVWPQNGLSGTVQIQATLFRQHVMPASFGATLDMRRNWLPTLCAGLASKIAGKYNPADQPRLDGIYKDMLQRRVAEESHEPVVIAYRSFGYGRARRH